jgi:osmoprotectant transport system ATP-binding protein
MPAPIGPAIAFQGVTKYYTGDVVAVDNVSLAIAGGGFVALVGASGSGKSTLLKTVNRLVEPSTGTVTIDGVPIETETPHRLRRRIGYVFQNIGLFPHWNVADNIGIAGRLAGERHDDARITEWLALVGLEPDLARRMPSELSGGQQQRVGIARAIAGDARILLMDEPFGALDPVTRDALGREIAALHARLGLTTILVTHDMAEAMLLADRVLVMERGRIVADATPDQLMAGRAGAAADALVAVPREQAARLSRLADGA